MVLDAESVHHQASVYFSTLTRYEATGQHMLTSIGCACESIRRGAHDCLHQQDSSFCLSFLYIIFVDALVRKKLRVAFHGRNVLTVVRVYGSLLKVVTASVSGDRARTHV